MDGSKLRSMLRSGDDSMKALATAVLKGGSLRNVDNLERVILLLHTDDTELIEKAMRTMLSLKKKMTYLEAVLKEYVYYSGRGQSACMRMQEIYRGTKKLRSFFYTEEEWEEKVKKQKKWGAADYLIWGRPPEIKIKHFKQTNHGKK